LKLVALKAARELGLAQVGWLAWYRFGLRSGRLRRQTPTSERRPAPTTIVFRPVLQLPEQDSLRAVLDEASLARLLEEAEEVVCGKARLFGGPPVPLSLAPPGPLAHWTAYSGGEMPDGADIKLTWEPGRFGWGVLLGRAYYLSGDERFPQAFWELAETFLDANPVNLGPHWASGQEVALRLIALVFALHLFNRSPHTTPERLARLAQAIAAHAGRIPATLSYARAQNNNHLLSEAAGLYSAAVALPTHPQAEHWRGLGWRWFHGAVRSQIDPDGAYIQHSANYHRLALQLGLWVFALAKAEKQPLPAETSQQFARATRWLQRLLDPSSGRVPNLGPNDGAYILPLAACHFDDFRPVLQACGRAFCAQLPLPAGPWDEMSLWFGLPGSAPQVTPIPCDQPAADSFQRPIVLHAKETWATLRAANFHSRPGHADQLHFDMWWRGVNICQDAGAYQYNGAPPWDNALAGSDVHNTITIDGQDQMTRQGRFLFLDWAQAQVIASQPGEDGALKTVAACHNGYCKLGLLHQRSVTIAGAGDWVVNDAVLPLKKQRALQEKTTMHTIRLHWLLPDLEWEVLARQPRGELLLRTTEGEFRLKIFSTPNPGMNASLQIARAGELKYGSGPVMPHWGWASPTYSVKVPALAISYSLQAYPPVTLTSEFLFPSPF
jgi:hypothetical protein